MRNKTRLLTLLATVMVFALLVAGLSLTAFADDNAFKLTKADGTETIYQKGTGFASVIAGAPAGSTITLLADADVEAGVDVPNSVTIDLNGFTVTTTNRLTPKNTAHVIFKNGTIDITKTELVYMNEWGSQDAKFELNNVTVKKGESGANKTLVDMRVGTVIFDGVTINEGEWNANFTSPLTLISMGYRTRQVSQKLTLQIKNSNINLTGIPVFNGTGASGETNGYTLDVDVINSTLKSTTNVFMVQPAASNAANCYVDVDVTEGSVLTGTPMAVNANAVQDQINIMLDYGVTSKRPTKGTYTLGNDGNGVLHFVNGEFESSNTGTVTDLWSDNQTPVPREDYAYTFVQVGDTQYITDSSSSDKLSYVYDWILENQEAQNIQFVFGMGDITNHSRDDEWAVAVPQIYKLNGKIPYSLVRGNHDTSDSFNANLNNETYRSMFDGFYSEDGAENAYVTFTVGDQKFMNVTLDYFPSNDVLNWASNVIQSHPDHKVIISTHAFIEHDGDLLVNSGVANNAEQMWKKLISQHPNIFLVLSGHVYATDVGRIQMTGVYGNTVTAIIADGQCHDFKNGPMGLISLLHFSEDGKKLTVEYYSTVHDKFFGKNSQFTLDIPEFDSSTIGPQTHLYEIIDKDGNSVLHADTKPLSLILSIAPSGSTIKLLGNVDVDSGCSFSTDVTIDLNGYTISTEKARISSSGAVTVKNGTIKVVNYELFYISEGSPNSNLTFTDIDVIHTGSTASKFLCEIRDGSFTLDNVRIEAANWKGTNCLMACASRTKVESAPVNVTIKNSNISIGCPIVYYGGGSNEVNGYTANVSIINSTLTTTSKIFKTNPTDGAASKCYANFSADANTVLNAANIFEINKIAKSNITITLAAGAKFGGLPVIDGANMVLEGDVFVYNNTTAMLTLADSKTVDTSKVACKLVKDNGDVLCYWEGSVLNQELLTYAQNAACSIVLVGDMTTPAGTSSSARYSMDILSRNLTIDLDGNVLNMGAYAYFGTGSGSKVLTIKDGTVKHSYTVFYSYNGPSTCGFTAEKVEFINSTSSSVFDHRMGVLTLTDCTLTLGGATSSECNVFTLGNTNRTTGIEVYLSGCTINATISKQNIFKTYCGQPTTLVAENCTFSVKSSAYIVYANTGKGMNPADSFTFKNCTLSKDGNNLSLFSLVYSTPTITLDEVYVPTNSKIELTKGTLKIKEGQVRAEVEGGGYMITDPKVKIQANLSLYIDFTMNIWLPAETNVKSITVDGVTYKVEDANVIDGKYRISIASIGAGEAADDITILVTYADGEKTLTVEKKYSVIEYAKSILESDKYSNEAKALLASIVGYVNSVYVYDAKAVPASLSNLMSGTAYKNAITLSAYDTVTAVPETSTSIDTAKNAISGAKLSLDSSVQFIFTLNSGYTGHLSLSYAGKTYECEVVNGKAGDKDHVIVEMRAFDLYDEVITITAGEYTGTYDLAAYVAGVTEKNQGNESLSTLLLNLYNYCKEADEYKAYTESTGNIN